MVREGGIAWITHAEQAYTNSISPSLVGVHGQVLILLQLTFHVFNLHRFMAFLALPIVIANSNVISSLISKALSLVATLRSPPRRLRFTARQW